MHSAHPVTPTNAAPNSGQGTSKLTRFFLEVVECGNGAAEMSRAEANTPGGGGGGRRLGHG
ncbi:hypothetical protein IF2G_04798 [Cordyceps javanica]|nr:hypothetical protein IF2G_04798 [Cordyceps javanica]